MLPDAIKAAITALKTANMNEEDKEKFKEKWSNYVNRGRQGNASTEASKEVSFSVSILRCAIDFALHLFCWLHVLFASLTLRRMSLSS